MQENSKIPSKCLSDANPTLTVLWYQNWCETGYASESEVSDMINFAMFHQLLRFWVGK